MVGMQDYRKLHVWQRAQALAARVHKQTEVNASRGNTAWRSQVRRSAQSIGANIAEGALRDTPRQFAHFLEIAMGSASETESHLDFALRVGVLDSSEALLLLSEANQLQRMIAGLRRQVLKSRE